MGKANCFCGQVCQKNGNCPRCREDGLPVQCVGPWAREKHDYLTRTIEATWAVRAKFVRASPRYPTPGGAAYIDLFAGPGRAKIDTSGEVIDGSPLIAAKHEKARFSKVILCELDPDNVAALRVRMAPFGGRVSIIEGDCTKTLDQAMSEVPPHGLNFALVDPFGPKGLRWDVFERLGAFKRMDTC